MQPSLFRSLELRNHDRSIFFNRRMQSSKSFFILAFFLNPIYIRELTLVLTYFDMYLLRPVLKYCGIARVEKKTRRLQEHIKVQDTSMIMSVSFSLQHLLFFTNNTIIAFCFVLFLKVMRVESYPFIQKILLNYLDIFHLKQINLQEPCEKLSL